MKSEEKLKQYGTKELVYVMISLVFMGLIATGLFTCTESRTHTAEPVFHGRLFILSFI